MGIPVYTGNNYLTEAIESLPGQTLAAFELIISDDATREICQYYAAHDAHVFYRRSAVNRGARWNFPRVFHLARGKYFKWAAHDDDFWQCMDTLPDKKLLESYWDSGNAPWKAWNQAS